MKKLPAFVLSTALLFPLSLPVYAAETTSVVQSQSLTYEQALERAFNASIPLKNAADEIDRSFEIRQTIGSGIQSYPIGVGNGEKEAAERAKAKALIQADTAWGISKRKYDLEKDNIIYSVKTAYNNVLKAQKQKELAEANVKNQEVQKNVAFYKASEGALSQYELSQEEGKYNSALKQKAAADKALDDAWTKLNALIGAPQEARFALVDEPQFKPFERSETDLENDITYVVSNSDLVDMAEKQLKIQRLNVELYTYNASSSTSYKAEEIGVRQVANKVDDTKKNLADGMRAIYYSIKQLEDQYKALTIELKKAEETLKMAQVRYDTGVGIKADVTAAELAVADKKKKIFDTLIQLDNLKLAYEKPWVVAGASAGGGSAQ
ncbi:TolC family protein [Aneurinibacillus thermoaerophilus]|uniref:Outer membrane efflux protein n=1 Tax=Aneurinibacillus thermoaerophilus TaxID=143495 RepID=A0A1G8DKX9_ANETH|nr:TolC family protein [Aneurinibacillus thermoaerophilus]MED0757795.1 TolC family protein [Aneurinibacillus thermoaerophilus]MED0761521.1 TolC family protein [Aneurinibacillus thermoaerophilus]SDH58354.1 Outer membrane efflux protein [Aneurinibacillus thermoaerophilus]